MSIRIFYTLLIMMLSLGSALPPLHAHDISIEEAYRATSDERILFDAAQSRIPLEDRRYLDHMFFVSDMALRARVLTMINLHSGSGGMSIEKYNREIDELITSFELVETPHRVFMAEKALVSAIREQQAFLNEWAMAEGERAQEMREEYKDHRKVQRSHQKLLSAYGLLRRSYPYESQYNHKAMYDHIAALDFI